MEALILEKDGRRNAKGSNQTSETFHTTPYNFMNDNNISHLRFTVIVPCSKSAFAQLAFCHTRLKFTFLRHDVNHANQQ